jgi:hypothetical protein
VVAAVEIGIGKLVGHAVECVRIQHQAAEHGLLGIHGLRRHPQLFDPGVVLLATLLRSCAHQLEGSPLRAVVADRLFLFDGRHRRTHRDRGVADKSWDILWITRLTGCDQRKNQ